MIGIYDAHLSLFDKLAIPNVEAMKIAEYYRAEKRHFSRLILPGEENKEDLTTYDKIYYCSDFESTIPNAFKMVNNVEYVGYQFTKDKYITFEDDLIDFTIPRTYIYKPYLREKREEGMRSKDINLFLDNFYYRCYNGREVMPISPGATRKKFYIYDKDFFYPGWEENLQKIKEKNPTAVFTLQPIICKTPEDFLKLREKVVVARSNEIILDFDFSFTTLDALLRDYEKKFRAEINRGSRIYIPFGAREELKHHTYVAFGREFIDRLNIMYAFWARNIPIKLKYIAPQIGEVNPIEKLFLLTEAFSRSKKNCLEVRMRGGVKEDYQFFNKMFPRKHNLFIQTYEGLKSRRFWRYDR